MLTSETIIKVCKYNTLYKNQITLNTSRSAYTVGELQTARLHKDFLNN